MLKNVLLANSGAVGIVVTVVVVLIVVMLLLMIMTRIKTCPPDKVLVVYGKNKKNKDGTYTVFLKIIAPVQPMLELKFVVPDKKTAQNIYKKWESKASELYSAIYETLVD